MNAHGSSRFEVTGMVVTKLDGTAKGGVILSTMRQFDIPVKFVGVGEAADDHIRFDPQAYVNYTFRMRESLRLRLSELLLLICVAIGVRAATDVPYLVKDLPDPIRGVGSLSSTSLWTTIGNISWFSADRRDGKGSQVWKTDGTAAGTVCMTEQLPDHSASAFVGVVSGRIVYTGDAGWGGGLLALDENGGAPESLVWGSFDFRSGGVLHKGALYFGSTARQAGVSKGLELWRTDGTAAGTSFADLNPGVDDSLSTAPMAVLGDWILFAGQTGEGKGVFRTDGTAAGTTRLVEIPAQKEPGNVRLTLLGGQVVFAIEGLMSHTDELWITDGTPEGTRAIATGLLNFRPLAVLGGKLLFNMDAGAGEMTWTTDGTAAGTRAFDHGNSGIDGPRMVPGAVVEGKYFFFVDDVAYNPYDSAPLDYALFTTEGLPGTTKKVMGGLELSERVFRGFGWNGRFYFGAEDPAHGKEWWSSDGTAAGTGMVGDFFPGRFDGFFQGNALVRPDGFLIGIEGWIGHEPWLIDGTSAGSRLVKNIGMDVPEPGSNPYSLCAARDRIFFFAEAGYGLVIGRSNGTYAGTTAEGVGMIDLFSVYGFVGAGSRCYATVIPVRYGKEMLFSTDGTEAGTVLLSSDARSVVAFGEGVLFKELSDDSIRYSDGTTAGTQAVLLPHQDEDWEPHAANGKAWFTTRAFSLAVSDGIGPARYVRPPGVEFEWFDGLFEGPDATYLVDRFYSAERAIWVKRLWRTDGTTKGTRIVKVFPGPLNGFFHTTEKLFFAYDGAAWSTDGTEANTVPLPAPGMYRDRARGKATTAVVGKELFWCAQENGETDSLWKSDGTVGGTVKLATFLRTFAPCQTMAAFEGRVYFAATDGAHGSEPWVSDGTVSGTHMLADLFPGVDGSVPVDLTIAAGHLFFTAESQDAGRELWAIGERGHPRRRAAGH